MYTCKFCNSSRKNTNSLKQHEIRCKLNPDRISVILPERKESQEKRKGRNQFTKAKELGLPKPEVSFETRQKLSNAAKLQGQSMWTEEQRKFHSDRMKEAVKNNPDSYTKNNVCGRVKIYDYNGRKLKGKWELHVARWLDSCNVIWDCECNPQPYFWNESWHMYFPDFYLSEYDVYIEVKGYKRDRDIAKWKYFKGTLAILDKEAIKDLEYFHDIEEIVEKYRFKGL